MYVFICFSWSTCYILTPSGKKMYCNCCKMGPKFILQSHRKSSDWNGLHSKLIRHNIITTFLIFGSLFTAPYTKFYYNECEVFQQLELHLLTYWIRTNRSAFAPLVHQWTLVAHDPVANSPLFLYPTFYSHWTLHIRNTQEDLQSTIWLLLITACNNIDDKCSCSLDA